MLIAYLDETYVDGRAYIVGALVLTPKQDWALKLAFEGILRKTHAAHGTPLNIEFHGNALFQQTEQWGSIHGKQDVAYAIYRRAASKIVATGGRIFLRGVDRIQRLETRYVRPDSPHTIALGHLLERVNDYATQQGERVRIIADQVPEQAQHEERMRVYQPIGTPGYRPSNLDRIDMPFTWASSAEHTGLQAIDLALYIYRRKMFHADSSVARAFEVKRIRDVIYPAFHYHNMWEVPLPGA